MTIVQCYARRGEEEMTDLDKMQFIRYMQMRDELENVAYGGIELKLYGKYADAHDIASVCVFCEDNDYMRDYRRDDSGRISELNFDRVKDGKR